jgi:hypothetical protein
MNGIRANPTDPTRIAGSNPNERAAGVRLVT